MGGREVTGDELLLSADKGEVAKLQGDESASQSSRILRIDSKFSRQEE